LHSLDGKTSDEFFSIHQNSRLVKNAENYYRHMYSGEVSSWNLRDIHMTQTIREIDQYLSHQLQRPAKIIVWAHNSHIGDAMATEQAQRGELNVGQLMRDQYPAQVYLLGFTTHHGYVTAASEWGGIAERKRVNPALPNSYESIFHDTGLEQFMLITRGREELHRTLPTNYLERAIGVIYLPHSERISHYFQSNIVRQFDAVIHIDETHAVTPLEKLGVFHLDDAPETYPSGF
jgi:erythromycin esterase-like protein